MRKKARRRRWEGENLIRIEEDVIFWAQVHNFLKNLNFSLNKLLVFFVFFSEAQKLLNMLNLLQHISTPIQT